MNEPVSRGLLILALLLANVILWRLLFIAGQVTYHLVFG